jgi:RHS repeat-associated protein
VREGEQETREKFQGKEYEERTGLYDFHARQYDPVLGRMWSWDPKNQFASGYVGMGNNPVNGIDPDGQYFLIDDIIAGAVGGIVNLAVNALQGNLGGHGLWGGIGRGFAAFGAGAVGGVGLFILNLVDGFGVVLR